MQKLNKASCNTCIIGIIGNYNRFDWPQYSCDKSVVNAKDSNSWCQNCKKYEWISRSEPVPGHNFCLIARTYAIKQKLCTGS